MTAGVHHLFWWLKILWSYLPLFSVKKGRYTFFFLFFFFSTFFPLKCITWEVFQQSCDKGIVHWRNIHFLFIFDWLKENMAFSLPFIQNARTLSKKETKRKKELIFTMACYLLLSQTALIMKSHYFAVFYSNLVLLIQTANIYFNVIF